MGLWRQWLLVDLGYASHLECTFDIYFVPKEDD